MADWLVRFEKGGVELPDLGLWLDPHAPKAAPSMVFVSHAHADHIAQHDRVIASRGTLRLMRSRLPGQRVEHALPFRESAPFQGKGAPFEMALFPAGHVLGSAMALVTSAPGSLLYTGDFKLRPGRSAESCEPVHADVLVMETTFGRPVYAFPPTDAVLAGVIRFCRDAIANDETPILLGYSLGKSQEILRGLTDAGLPVTLHPQVAKMTRVYEELGQSFPEYQIADRRRSGRGRVWICPPGAALDRHLSGVGPTRTAVLTGWAVDSGCQFRYRCDAAFPLSDHADFPDLIEFVRRVAPRKVYTLHGFAADFAQTLRELGFNAQALSQPEQLGFLLPIKASTQTAAAPTEAPATGDSDARAPILRQPAGGNADGHFSGFAGICESIRETAGKSAKIGLLGAYFASLQPADLKRAVVWLTGLVFAPIHDKPMRIGGAQLRDALCDVTETDRAAYRLTYLKHSDTGETAMELLLNKVTPAEGPSDPPPFTLGFLEDLFDRLQAARGPMLKRMILREGLKRCAPVEGKYLVKILTGNLRIGLKEGLVEEALAKCFGTSPRGIQRAHLLLGDLGEVARHAADGTLDRVGLVPLRPLKCMLASPETTAEAAWNRIGRFGPETDPPPAWLEDKYDGIRCQLHCLRGRVRLFSRDLKDITAAFPDVTSGASRLGADVILDGEIIGWNEGRPLPFSLLQKRLGRSEDDLFLTREIPVQYRAFDLLWIAGDTLLEQPLSVRRMRLEQIGSLPEPIALAEVGTAAGADGIDRAFDAARRRGHEGLLIKDPGSLYVPGRRGRSWVKFKKALGTLDCVVAGAELGHGKRSGIINGARRKGPSGAPVHETTALP